MERIELPPHIFREYDIRGLVDSELSESGIKRLGLAIAATFSRENTVDAIVGRDVRHSSERFFEALSDGLRAGGVNVIDIGEVPTPVFYFAAKFWRMRGGVMITASHNPPQYNGFKVLRGEGTIYGRDILELRDMIAQDLPQPGGGRIEERDVRPHYVDHLARNISLQRRISFALDGGNGTAGLVAPELFSRLAQSPRMLFMEPDGNFPNHHPDPTVIENVRFLRQAVLEDKLELGVAFDGDADRIGVIDDKGDILWGDRLLALFARDILRSNPGATVIFEVKCSRALEEDISRHGGKPLMWKTGHSLIKKKMREVGAALAGEMSGHIFFADRYYGYDDAIYAACRLLEIVSRGRVPLSSLLSDLPRYETTPEIRVDCPDERKFAVVEAVRKRFSKTHRVIDVDGARISFEDGWGLVRASNTQPVLVLRFEASSAEALRAIRNEVVDALAAYVDVSAVRGG